MEDHFSAALKPGPLDAEGLYALSRVYGKFGQTMAQRVWELKPDSYRSHQLLGEVYENIKNYENALKQYREALRLNPGAPGLHYAIGHTFWKMKRFDEAVPELERELALNPYHPSANYVLGHIYVHLGRHQAEKASRYLRRAVEAKPDFVEARMQWGKALSLLDDNERAVQELEIVAKQEPEDDSVHYLFGGAVQENGVARQSSERVADFHQATRYQETRAD